jgi:hypothetical protein
LLRGLFKENNAKKYDSFYLYGALLSPDVQNQVDEKVKGVAQKIVGRLRIRILQGAVALTFAQFKSKRSPFFLLSYETGISTSSSLPSGRINSAST